MFSYLLTALAAALCLLGALMIYANFHFLLEQQRGKNTSFMPCLGAVFWCLGIYCIPKQYAISGYWYAVALLDIGVWILPLSLMYMINKARAHAPACWWRNLCAIRAMSITVCLFTAMVMPCCLIKNLTRAVVACGTGSA